MSTWFQFKQFTIHQEKTAMKVCTDACLFGAWVAKKLEYKRIKAENILDIGCGTGLLSLMLVQKTEAQIDAVEIDENSYKQARENFDLTEWKERINIHHISIIDFKTPKKYELIISNPPFYEDQLKSTDATRNNAMHTINLTHLDLVNSLKKNLAKGGIATILLPYNSVQNFEKILNKKQLFVYEKLNVSHSPQHPFFRSLLLISENKKKLSESSVSIKNEEGDYSREFIEPLKDYYLNF